MNPVNNFNPFDALVTLPFEAPINPNPRNLQTLNATAVNALVQQNSYGEILTTQEHFWTLFCQAVVATNPENGANNDIFRVSQSGSALTIFGREHIVRGIQNFLGYFRQLLLESFNQKKNIELCLVSVTQDFHLRPIAAVIDCSDWLSDLAKPKKISRFKYANYIGPYLSRLMENLGAACNQIIRNVTINSDPSELFAPRSQKTKIISIQWKSDCHLIYPIPRQEVPKLPDLAASSYELYKNQVFCDTTLTATDNQEIKVHALVLFQRGGEMFPKLLESGMADAKDKIIHFNHSIQVVRAYADFIYLGDDSLKQKVYNKQIDLASLSSLFQLAHYCGCQPLQIAAANFITLVANPREQNEMAYVKTLADQYDNAHLQQFCSQVSTLPLPASSKV